MYIEPVCKSSKLSLMLRGAVSLAAGCLALAPATATADQRIVFDTSDFAEKIGAGPVLAGGGVLWSAPVVSGERLFTAAPGGLPRALQVLAPAPVFDGNYESGSSVERLTAAPGHVAYVRAGWDELKGKIEGNGRTGESIWLADADRPPTRLLACGSDVASASVALDGTLLASTGCAEHPVVQLRDLAAPDAAPRELAAAGTDVRIAAPYAAWRTPDAIVVHDLVAGAEAYRVGLTQPALPGPVVTYDLQRDGKVAIGTSDPQNASVSHLAWAARDAPAPRVLPPLRGQLRVLRIAADRAAVRTVGSDGWETVLLVDPSGSARAVARITPAGGGLDFDGTHLTWAGEACAAAILHIKDAEEPGVSEDRRTHCAVRVPDPNLQLNKRGRGYIELLCPAPHPARRGDRCAGRLVVRTLTGRRIAQRRFRISAGETGLPTIHVASRVLKRQPPRRVRLVVTSRTRGHVSKTRRVLRLRVR